MVIRQLPPTPPPPPPAPRARSGSGLRLLSRYGPIAAGYAVFQSLVGVLPPSLSADAARYTLAVAAGVAVGLIVWLSALLARQRAGNPPGAAPGAGAGPAAAPAAAPLPDVSPYLGKTAAALLETRSTVDDPNLGRLVGWAHFLEEAGARPTAIGTAYGLHTVLTLARTDGLLDPPALVETLWRLQLDDGGWAARTGVGVSRPEVTALVIGALSRAGAYAGRIAQAVDSMEAMLQPETDPEGLASTYVVAAALRGVVRAAPHSPLIARLRAELVAGALNDTARGGRLCWGHRLSGTNGRRNPAQPSTVHTAKAVLALARASQVLAEDTQSRHAREEGLRWLTDNGNLDAQTEHLRRPRPAPAEGMDHLVIRHFTAVWVAKALLSADPAMFRDDPEGAERRAVRLRAAVTRVWDLHRDGVWEWTGEDGERRPIYMTYQGLSVLRSAELSSGGMTV